MTLYNPLHDSTREYLTKFYDMRSYHGKREYVEHEMRQLIENGEFYLTGLMMLGPEIRDIVGDVILGFDRTAGVAPSQIAADNRDDEIFNHTVELKNPDGGPIKWQDGKKRVSNKELMTTIAFLKDRDIVIKKPSHKTRENGSNMRLRDAYLALKQKGLWVAKSPDSRGNLPSDCLIETPPWEAETKAKRK
ncbi:hypothetical protein [Rhodobacteraceae phage LS06-2018-MD06]|jgi:hypothetical protein|nr:hypothetical protein [Rhodobacteraceae phage LS06-2018-MD06]